MGVWIKAAAGEPRGLSRWMEAVRTRGGLGWGSALGKREAGGEVRAVAWSAADQTSGRR